MAASTLDDPELDTHLARLLHERGLIPLPTLQHLLSQARQARPAGASLAHTLVAQRLLPRAEIEALLAELHATLPSAAAHAAPGGPGPGLGPGARVGPYELIRRLGQGGMGTVFEGRHRESGASHAVKVLAGGGNLELAIRFRREGQAMARVDDHPNVARVHTSGVGPGYLYLAMDMVSGGDLASRIRRCPLPPQDAADLVEALAHGLSHVHQHGVLHRDLKPANVLLDEAGVPLLVDFGLARLSDARSLTETGTIMGSPGYMAPEQAEGLGQVDERTDVYGLGAVLYACLTGQPPFTGVGVLAVLSKVLSGEPQPPRSTQPEIPEALERVCLRALAKVPAKRYPTARALAEDLARVRLGESPQAAGRPAATRWLLAAGGLAVVGGLGLAWSSTTEAPPILTSEPAPVEAEAASDEDPAQRLLLLYQAAWDNGLPPEIDPELTLLLAERDPDWEERFRRTKTEWLKARVAELSSTPEQTANDLPWIGAHLRAAPEVPAPLQLHERLDRHLVQLLERFRGGDPSRLVPVLALGTGRWEHLGSCPPLTPWFQEWVEDRLSEWKNGAAYDLELALAAVRLGIGGDHGLTMPYPDLASTDCQRIMRERPYSRATAYLALQNPGFEQDSPEFDAHLLNAMDQVMHGANDDLGPGYQVTALGLVAGACRRLVTDDEVEAERRPPFVSRGRTALQTERELATEPSMIDRTYRDELALVVHLPDVKWRPVELAIRQEQCRHLEALLEGDPRAEDLLADAVLDQATHLRGLERDEEALDLATSSLELIGSSDRRRLVLCQADLLLALDRAVEADAALAPILERLLLEGRPEHVRLCVRVALARDDRAAALERLEQASLEDGQRERIRAELLRP
jgi:Protein kinase domain